MVSLLAGFLRGFLPSGFIFEPGGNGWAHPVRIARCWFQLIILHLLFGQRLYHAAVKHTELGPEGVYRYYSTQRPVDIGTYPKLPDNQPLSIVNYDDDRRRPVADGSLMAWGELTYAKPLTEKQMEDYELKPAPGNPDLVRPSITSRLKEGTRGQKPPKEPGQKRSHKNHEER